MAEGSNGRRRFSDKWGKHELDVLAVLSSAFPQWLTSRQIAQRVKAYADSYGELADQAAKAAFAKQFQRDRAKLAAMGIAAAKIEGRLRGPEYCAVVVDTARKALNREEYNRDLLQEVFSRSGFTDGWFTGKNGGDMFGARSWF